LDCGTGPFQQSDIDKNVLVELGGGKQKLYYCRKCCKIKFGDVTPDEFPTLIESPIKKPIGEIPRIIEKPEISFAGLSGREIINLIKEKTGIHIPFSPKSKKAILKMARKIIEKI
jgi:hypothetical protein